MSAGLTGPETNSRLTSSPPALNAEMSTSEVKAEHNREVGRRGLARRVGLDRFSGIYVTGLLILVFSLLEPETFPTVTNLRIVLAGDAIAAILAVGLTIAVAAGAFDLSVAGTMTLSISMVGWLQATHGVDPVLASLLALAAGALVGLVNAVVVIGFRVSSMIATLGMMSVLVAVAYLILDGRPVVTGVSDGFKAFGRNTVLGVPVTVVYMVVVSVIVWYVLEKTPAGRRLRAVGGNEAAARLAGIRADRYLAGAFVASGFVAALAGVIFTARLGTSPIDAGSAYLLPAFAAVFLGATQIQRGRVNVWGTLVAIYLLAVGVSGLQLHFPDNPWLRGFFQGAMLIIAIAVASRGSVSRR